MAALSSITRTRCMRESASPDIGRLRRGERQRQGEGGALTRAGALRSEEHTSELQSRSDLVCRLLLEKKKKQIKNSTHRNDEIPPAQSLLHLSVIIPVGLPLPTDRVYIHLELYPKVD